MKNWREAENERSLKFFTYKQWNWNSAISFISYFTKVKLCTLLYRVCDLIRRDKIYQKSSFFCSTIILKINQIDDNFLNKFFFMCKRFSRFFRSLRLRTLLFRVPLHTTSSLFPLFIYKIPRIAFFIFFWMRRK